MIDPIILQKLAVAKPPAEFLLQLVRLDPDLAIPAAMPLLAARLLGAVGVDEDDEPEQNADLASA